MAKILALLEDADRYYDGTYTNNFKTLSTLVGTQHPWEFNGDFRVYNGTGYTLIGDAPGHSAHFSSVSGTAYYQFASNYGETAVNDVIWGMNIGNVNSWSNSTRLQNSSGADQLRLYYNNSTQLLSFYPNNTYDSDLDSFMPINEWHYLEFRVWYGTGSADGGISIWIDGILSATKTNISWTNNFSRFLTTSGQYIFTDVYCIIGTGATTLSDSDRLGPVRVTDMGGPTSSVTSDWVGSDADSVDNYLHVDEELFNYSSTDYVSGSSTGDVDTYRWDLSSISGQAPVGAYLEGSVQKSNVNPRTAAFVQIDGASTQVGETIALPGTYSRYGRGWITAPDGSTWTSTGLSDAHFGVKVID